MFACRWTDSWSTNLKTGLLIEKEKDNTHEFQEKMRPKKEIDVNMGKRMEVGLNQAIGFLRDTLDLATSDEGSESAKVRNK